MFLVMLTVGCSEQKSVNAVAQDCVNTSDCLNDQRCFDGVCVLTECQFDHECALQQICSSLGNCVEGCNDDNDCLSGEQCEAGVCQPYECRTTEIGLFDRRTVCRRLLCLPRRSVSAV